MGKYFWCKKDFMVVEIVRLHAYWYPRKEDRYKDSKKYKKLKENIM